MTTYIREKLPVILIIILAVAGVVMGVVSAATAQNLNHDPKLAPWEGVTNSNTNPVLAPWMPEDYTHTDPSGMRPTIIGRAGVIPEKPANFWPPAPVAENLPLNSLADSAHGPDMGKAMRATSLKERRVKTPNPLPDFAQLQLTNGELRAAEVKVVLKKGKEAAVDLTWRLNPVEFPIFIDKMVKLKPALSGSVNVTPSETDYDHVEVRMLGNNGQTYQPVSIYQNRVYDPSKQTPLEDTNRDLELWTLGTAKSFAQKDLITNLIKIWSFEDCKALNHTLIDAVPRQCVLPDGTTYLEIDEKLSEADKKIINFDTCLKAGKPLIMSFPRKCVAPGGRVYIEPPRL